MMPSLAMLGPIELAQFKDLLYPGVRSDSLPKGLGGSPVNLLSKELLRRGRRLLIATVSPDVRDEVVVEGENLKICIGPDRPKHARDFFAGERAYLLKVLRRERPDIVHAQWTYEFAMAAQASRLPHVITAHDAPINVLRRNFIPYRIARTMMAYQVLSRARRVVSVSPYVAKHLARFMLYQGSREVIPNGMPDALFSRAPGARLPGEHTTFATVLSGWAGLKNSQVAVEAFSILRRRHPGARLIMFGHGHGKGEEGDFWAREHGMAEGIEFAGHLPHSLIIDRLAHDVDVLVHPSLEEAQPMVLIEAMSLGLPVIGGKRSGGVPWTLNEGRAGILVDITNAKTLAEAMECLVDNADERLHWGRAGKEFARQRFHISVIADAYEQIYSDIWRKRA